MHPIVKDARREPDKMKEVSWSFFVSRYLPELAILGVIVLLQGLGIWWLLIGPAEHSNRWIRRAVLAGGAATFAIEGFGLIVRFHRVAKHFPAWVPGWGRGLVMAWALLSLLSLLAFALAH